MYQSKTTAFSAFVNSCVQTFSSFIKEDAAQSINQHILTDHHLQDSTAHFYVFRLQGSDRPLDNSNAGDLLGAAKYSSSDDAEMSATGSNLAVYEITNPTPGKFEEYVRYRQGKILSGKPGNGIGREQQPIKWGINRHQVYWYSFPAGGDWTAKLVEKISEQALKSKAKQMGFGYFGENELEDCLVIYDLVFGKAII